MWLSKLPFRGLSTGQTLPNIIHRYESLLAEGLLVFDASQVRCLDRLQGFLEDLHSYGKKLRSWEEQRNAYEEQRQRAAPQIRQEIEAQKAAEDEERRRREQSSMFSQILDKFRGADERANDGAAIEAAVEQRLIELFGQLPAAPYAPKGVYLHGSVGSGKTMLADMFYQAAAVESNVLPLHRRVHCNAALLELHSRMHSLERAAAAKYAAEDPVKHAKLARMAQRRLARERLVTSPGDFAKEIAAANSAIMLKAARAFLQGGNAAESTSSAALLCFDEMQTTDPYNVAALKALTEAALADGGALVATSNRAPRELSPHGLHEAMFEHFIEAIEAGCDVVELSSAADYRKMPLLNKAHTLSHYYYPLNEESAEQLSVAWSMLPGEDSFSPISVPVMFGRSLQVLRHKDGAAWFHFDELCSRPLGPSDYVALAATFHTVFISDVPAMSMRVRDKARRFITLVDEIYNRRGRLVCSAAVSLEELFAGAGEEASEEPLVDLEGLQFEGAVEGGRLRRDLGAAGGVAPVAATPARLAALGGEEEKFAFARAVSRLYEMQHRMYGNNNNVYS